MHLNVVFVRTQWNFFFRTTFTLILWMTIVLPKELADLLMHSYIQIPLIYANYCITTCLDVNYLSKFLN